MKKFSYKGITTGLVGATALAGGSQAYGEVVSVGVPSNLRANQNVPSAEELWDVNGDGTADFQFAVGFSSAGTYASVAAGYYGGVVGYTGANGFYYASRLQTGDTVGTGSSFYSGATLASRFANTNYGQFRTRGFLGFEFAASDGEHYGYIELRARANANQGRINFFDAAYETDPGVPITIPGAVVPEPTSLAALACGMAGLAGAAAYRRKKASRPTA